MDVNGNCHCNQGFVGDSCDEFCPEDKFGIPPHCFGKTLIQPKTAEVNSKNNYPELFKTNQI